MRTFLLVFTAFVWSVLCVAPSAAQAPNYPATPFPHDLPPSPPVVRPAPPFQTYSHFPQQAPEQCANRPAPQYAPPGCAVRPGCATHPGFGPSTNCPPRGGYSGRCCCGRCGRDGDRESGGEKENDGERESGPVDDGRPESALANVARAAGAFAAPTRSGAVTGASNSFGINGMTLVLPEIRLSLPTIELPSFFRKRRPPQMQLESAVAPYVQQSQMVAAYPAGAMAMQQRALMLQRRQAAAGGGGRESAPADDDKRKEGKESGKTDDCTRRENAEIEQRCRQQLQRLKEQEELLRQRLEQLDQCLSRFQAIGRPLVPANEPTRLPAPIDNQLAPMGNRTGTIQSAPMPIRRLQYLEGRPLRNYQNEYTEPQRYQRLSSANSRRLPPVTRRATPNY